MAADEELQDFKNNMEQNRAAGGQSEDHYEQNIKPDSVIREDSDSLKKEIAKFKKTSEITLEKLAIFSRTTTIIENRWKDKWKVN